jgi:hypothetical protein
MAQIPNESQLKTIQMQQERHILNINIARSLPILKNILKRLELLSWILEPDFSAKKSKNFKLFQEIIQNIENQECQLP